MNKRALAPCITAAVLLTPLARAQVELPDPVITNSAPAFSDEWAVFHILDNDLDFDYASQGQGTDTFVDFDFGTATAIGQVIYTDRRNSGGGNGPPAELGPFDNVTSYSLLFSNDPGFGTSLLTVAVDSPLFANTDPPVLINGGLGVTAQYVRFAVTGASGANVGAAEIQFFGAIPEPSTLSLLGIAALGLLARRGQRGLPPRT